MAEYKSNGDVVDYIATSDVNGGDVVVSGGILNVIISNILEGETGSAYVKGVFNFDTDESLDVGDDAFWNATSSKITSDSSDIYAGKVVRDTTSSKVLININFLGADGGIVNSASSTLGFFGVGPIDQEDNIPNASGGSTQVAKDPEARSAVNAILGMLENYGLMAGS